MIKPRLVFKQLKIQLCIFILMSISPFAFSIELMKWERMPLAVPLHVGQERMIFVDSNVRVGVPSLLEGKLRVQTTGGVIYLLASEPIAPTRLQLQDAQSGGLMLIDIEATIPEKAASSLEAIQIIEGDHTPVRYAKNSQLIDKSSTAKTTTIAEAPIPVVLTRYAAQNLYAPMRTIETVRGVSPVNINVKLNLTSLLPSQAITANALAAWRLDNYLVSAIKLTNTSTQLIELDPRLLQGDFIAATFQHQTLDPKGAAGDTTTVYLVTYQKSLDKAILPSISRFNAMLSITKGANDEK